ncbi:hypothetical protein, partial [Thiolapillus sp.]|uniref:hypothetical protein n=1 Tax=Thiolapillus sp. TaxID=2017437 RepID=UPI003AF62C6A
ISSPCHLCNLEYDKVELRIGTKNNRNYSKRKSMIYRDLTVPPGQLIAAWLWALMRPITPIAMTRADQRAVLFSEFFTLFLHNDAEDGRFPPEYGVQTTIKAMRATIQTRFKPSVSSAS